MTSYALINENGMVINIIEWDGESDYNHPKNMTLEVIGNSGAEIGWMRENNIFISPQASSVLVKSSENISSSHNGVL